MKCKSWSNKINNFVVRRLKSIKSNGPQHQPTTSNCSTTSNAQQPQQQQQQQQQYINNCCSSTMPAMPKEKATAVSLTENNFSELKYKELATSAAVVAATAASAAAAAAMATTAAASSSPVVNSSPLATSSSAPAGLRQQNSSSSLTHLHHHQQQQRNLCGCGNASATEVTMRTKYMTNGHSSPLAAAITTTGGQNTSHSPSSSPQRLSLASTASGISSNSSSCCRTRFSQTVMNGGGITANATDNIANTTATQFTLSSSASSMSSTASASTTTNTLNPNSSTPPLAVTPPKKSPKDFIFGKFIGEGSFSNVYLGFDKNTKREYAIKVCEKRQILREHKQEYIRREREVMHMMTNVPGFVNLSCTFQDARSLYFVMTYAKNGDLLPYINKVGSFDIDSTRHYAAELVLACEQMHRRNIVHRDLKPENILLDEDMHTLIADFGSVKILTAEERQQVNMFLMSGGIDLSKKCRNQSGSSIGESLSYEEDDDDDVVLDSQSVEYDENDSSGSSNDMGSGGDDVDSPRARRQQPRYHRKRRGSFVGTAQYVSPEVLQNSPTTPSSDLWALGCIIYQMMSGLPPFRGVNDYVIFKEIIACNLKFPQGFDKDAEDLVKKLLKLNPAERLGAQDLNGRYESIRSHPFFKNIDFDTVRQQTPPPISPFLPDLVKEEGEFKICEHLEPGLDEKQMTRLLGMELGCISDDDISDKKKTVNNKTQTTVTRSSNSCSSQTSRNSSTQKSAKNSFDLTDAEKHRRLELQKTEKWHAFAEGEVILKKGFVNKRKGLFARRRMFLLTTGPRIIYIDPVQMVKKGEIPWSSELRAEAKNFKIFFVHTPNRTYYLDDPEGFGLEWVAAIEKLHSLTYKQENNTSTSSTGNVIANATTTASTSCSAVPININSNKTSLKTSASPAITKTSSAISSSSSSTSPKTNTPHKTSSLLAKPIMLLKTASN